jgi:hypothetical protein
MKNISINEVGHYISEALENNKKNILFVDLTLRYEEVTNWGKNNPEYKICRWAPAEFREEKNGIWVKTGYYGLANKELKTLNQENSIWFFHAFSEKCIEDFDGILDVIKNRSYVNKFPDGQVVGFSLEKMSLFIAFTTPHNPNDWAALDEKYYALFDEVYLVQ